MKRRLQHIGTAKEVEDTVAIASFVRNGLFSLLISGPSLRYEQNL
jgi:hypothetical protein